MIGLELARALADAGLQWSPSNGDRFVVVDREMDDEVFLVSDMTVEVERLGTDGLVRFNGTTEWALDSIQQSQVVWLPREHDLRERLGEHFISLESSLVHDALRSHVVNLGIDGQHTRHVDADCECAYARALLHLLRHPRG